MSQSTSTATAQSEAGAFEIRSNRTVGAVLGVGGSVMAIAYLHRAAGSGGSLLDWVVCVLMAVIGISQLVALVDARTPLLVADPHGVRIRLGQEWLGLPWSALEQVLVEQRDTPLRDGRVVLQARHLDAAIEALLPSSRRALAWQRRLHGAPLTVPVSIGTRVSTTDVAAELRTLAAGRCEVVSHRGAERARVIPELRRAWPAVGRVVAGLAEGRDADVRPVPTTDLDPHADPHAVPHQRRAPAAEVEGLEAPPEAPAARLPRPRFVPPVSPARSARSVVRAEIVRERAPRTPAAPVEPTVPAVAVPTPEPERAVVVPVIGPQLRAARTRAGLSVEELSDRTRIRPHVLEALEVDDFGPCGGDFYARGHLRTLARFLALDPDGLVATYDERYAHAPINASRVFEAELATGMSGGLRAAGGGPRWSLLIGAVLSLVVVWGVARYFTEQPAQVASPITGPQAGLAANHEPITSPLTRTSTIAVKAIGGRTHVVVRDRTGSVLWRGTLRRGEERRLAGVAPFTVTGSNASVTRVELGKHWLGPVGTATTSGHRRVG